MGEFFGWLFQSIGDWLDKNIWSILLTIVLGYLVYKLGAKIISFIVKTIVFTIKRRSWHKKDIEKRQKTLSLLASTVWKTMTVIVIVTTLVEIIFPKANLSGLIAGLGIVGVAVGFGAQSLVKDFLSGLFIISENQYRVGDVIEINRVVTGKVERVGTRTTIMRDRDGNVHFIPNGTITHVANKTMDYSNTHFELRVNYDNDLNQIIDIINQVGKEIAEDSYWSNKVLETPHFDHISDFKDKVITISIIGKTLPSDQWDINSEMRKRIQEKFRQQGINP